MMAFKPGDIVRVPFPYTDGQSAQHRPALAIAVPGQGFLLWVLMVTSAANRGWPEDVTIADHRACGLPAPSVVRCAKIATIDAARCERRGAVTAGELAEVLQQVAALLGPAR